MSKKCFCKTFGLAILLSLFCATLSNAQQKTIQGKVTSPDNFRIPGVSVLLKGTNIGTITSKEGEFQIQIPQDGILIFSSIGFENQEINTKGKTSLNVILQEASQGMDEVVVVGYSQVEKQHVASSVAQLDMEKTKSRPLFKMQEAFSGTIPGVTMMQGSNLPGATPGNISIRGDQHPGKCHTPGNC